MFVYCDLFSVSKESKDMTDVAGNVTVDFKLFY